MPTITILVNIYNEKANLDDFFGSLVGQTYKDFSVLVIDDWSTDGSVEVVMKYAHMLNITIVSIEHSGLTKARKKWFDMIKEWFVAIFDADEIFDEKYLERFVETWNISRKENNICCFWWWRIIPYNNGSLSEILKYVDLLLYYNQYDQKKMAIRTLIWGNMIVEKSEVEKIGWLRGDCLEDTELSERIYQAWKKIWSNENAIVYHKYPTSLKNLLKREYLSWVLVKDQIIRTKNHLLRFSTLLVFPFFLFYWYYFFLLIKHTKTFFWRFFVVPWLFFLFFISWDFGYLINMGKHSS